MSCIKVSVPQIDFSSTSRSSNDDLLSIQNKYNELIKAAKKVFGSGWSHSVTNSTIDFIDQNGTNFSVGCYSSLKVILPNGIFHEDSGYSNIEGTTKGLSIEKARVTSMTNALAKVLSCFTEMDRELENFNQTLNVSAIPKTKFPLKRPISPPPPPAQSTPKVSRGPAIFDMTTFKEPESHSKAVKENVIDFNDIFDSVPTLGSSVTTSVTLTEEEMRLERLRKQREKQEEYKRIMREKEEKRKFELQKPNSKF